jgi:hypothetical protein
MKCKNCGCRIYYDEYWNVYRHAYGDFVSCNVRDSRSKQAEPKDES